MIFHVYTVKDNKLDQHLTPWFMINAKHALREFTDAINGKDPNTQLAQHPEDFDLHSLGTFDTETGELTVTKPTLLIAGKDVLIKRQ